MKTRQRLKTGAGLLVILLAMTCRAQIGHTDEAEDAAVKFIENLGGRIIREEKDPNKPIVRVSLALTKVTDAGLNELAGLKQLQRLYLGGTRVTDAGLKHLAGLKQLQELSVGGTRVTDAGKGDLKKALPKLKIMP
jgi:hypothetical protein